MTIIISTTDEDEARDLDEILMGIPWPYRIYLRGKEFRPEITRPADPVRRPEMDAVPRPHPGHVRMRQLLAERGAQGWRAQQLWTALTSKGLICARHTMHEWVVQDEQAGLVTRRDNRLFWVPFGSRLDRDSPAGVSR